MQSNNSVKMAHHNLDSLDKKILRMIAKDARVPFLEVARACNVSGAAIHQRIQKLTSMGVVAVEDWTRAAQVSYPIESQRPGEVRRSGRSHEGNTRGGGMPLHHGRL